MASNAEFVQRGVEFVKSHPDFNERLAKRHSEGFDMAPAATAEIQTLGMPEIVHWITDEAHADDRHQLLNLKDNPEASREFIRQLAARVERQGYGREAYSDADTHLAVRAEARSRGLSTTEMQTLKGMDSGLSPTDAYITARKLQRRGRR